MANILGEDRDGETVLAIVYKSFEKRLNIPLLVAYCSKISPFHHMR